jgi:L-threonylcarbamoyladenylate synthase
MTGTGGSQAPAPGRRMPAGAGSPVAEVREAVAILGSGGIIAYPTETVYGLGADPENLSAVDRVKTLKGGSMDRLVLLVADSEERMRPWVVNVREPAVLLMRRFWPGPLTLVFEASDRLPGAVRNARGTVAFRVSPDPVCAALARAFGKPIVSTSANPAGREPARSAEEVRGYFPDGLDAVLDGGPRPGSAPSTLVDVRGDVPRLLRRGPVSAGAIRSEIGSLDESETV